MPRRAPRGVRRGADDKCWLLLGGLLAVRALVSSGEWALKQSAARFNEAG